MSSSEPGEMAPESSQAMVFPKFDLHVYTSILIAGELKDSVTDYCIPADLHPCLPPPDLTIHKLPPRRVKKCFKEVTSSLKGWKNKFFLIDRQAVPDAMPLRYTDTDLRDDFPTNYNENDAARLAKFVVPLHPPPHHLLYVCGLTTACRHPDRVYNRKDQDGNVIGMDTFLKLLMWTGTIEPDRSGSGRTLSPALLHHAAPKNVEEPATIALNDTVGNATNVKREVVSLSGNTRMTTPPATVNQPSPRSEHHDTHEHTASDNTKEGVVDRRFMPNWGLRDNLRICTFRACKELVSHLATPAEEEFLRNLSNVEVVSRTYQSLGQVGSFENGPLKGDVWNPIMTP
ncbi:hypothetical protein Tco_0864228 [Tanacetum coccineum]